MSRVSSSTNVGIIAAVGISCERQSIYSLVMFETIKSSMRILSHNPYYAVMRIKKRGTERPTMMAPVLEDDGFGAQDSQLPNAANLSHFDKHLKTKCRSTSFLLGGYPRSIILSTISSSSNLCTKENHQYVAHIYLYTDFVIQLQN